MCAALCCRARGGCKPASASWQPPHTHSPFVCSYAHVTLSSAACSSEGQYENRDVSEGSRGSTKSRRSGWPHAVPQARLLLCHLQLRASCSHCNDM